MDNKIIEVGKLDVTTSRFPIRFESPIELADAVDILDSHYKRHYESRHSATSSTQRYVGSNEPNIALRVVAKESSDAIFSVEILPGSLLQDSIAFHGKTWKDCYDRNWWKPEYRGN